VKTAARGWKWFGVKSLFRTSAKGRPLGRDRFFDPAFTLIEERVILVRARSHDEAIGKAEREAKRYANEAAHRNPYGQSVVVKLLSCVDSYELFSPPAAGLEVYSRTEIVARSVSDSSLAKRLLGPERESQVDHSRRRNILDIALNTPAPGVTRTADEQGFAGRGRVGRRRRS
jgi:hypothetical protein